MPMMLIVSEFKTVVRPVLLYGSGTWAMRNAEQDFNLDDNVETDCARLG